MTDTRTGTDPKALVQYRNLAGAVVSVREHEQPTNPERPGLRYTAGCSGCMEGLGTDEAGRVMLSGARDWAAKHAARCAAIPPFATGAEVDRATWTRLAEEYAARAVRLLDGDTAVDGRVAHPLEARSPIESAHVYADLADVYARLAGR